MSRLQGFVLDFLIASAVSARPCAIVATAHPYEAGWHRWSGQARICTWLLAKHFFPDIGFERAIGEYGQTTGVISPGLILLKTCAPMQKLHMPE